MTQPYLAFLLLLAFVAFNAALLIGLSHLVAPHKPTVVKDAPYESGMPPLGNAHDRFSVKFHLVAMLFIVFDLETVFLIPWGAIYFGREIGRASCRERGADRVVAGAGARSLCNVVQN